MKTLEILSVTLENFQSYKTLDFQFPTQSGFYFIKGQNKVDTGMGGEGAGKSTLFDAICWAFNGKTPGGFKAGDIVCWMFDKKTASVTVRTNQGVLKRTQSPNSLIWEGNIIDQVRLNEIIGLSYEQFLITTLHGQSLDLFLEKSGSEQSEFLTQAMQLERWDYYQQKAKDKQKKKQTELSTLQLELKNMEGQIKQLEALNWEEDSLAWETSHKASIKEIALKMETLEKEKESLTEELKEIKQKQAELASNSLGEEPDTSLLIRLKQNSGKLTETIGGLSKEIDIAHKWIQYFQKTPSCSTCLQTISEEHSHKQLQEFEATLKETKEEILFTQERKETVDQKITELTSQKEQYTIQLRAFELQKSQLTQERSSCEKDLNRIILSHNQYQKDLEKKKDEKNPFLKKKEETDLKLKTLKTYVHEVSSQVDTLFKEAEHCGFWVQGFRDIKISQFQKFLHQLETESNLLLKKLSMSTWSFSISSATNNGGYTTISIDASHNDKKAPLRRYSGGEGVRLKLVFQIALGTLLRRITESSFGIEVFDEPFRYLSEEGILTSLDLLKEYSQLSEKQVYLIDHSVHSWGGFDGEVLVVKDSEGSHAEWEV